MRPFDGEKLWGIPWRVDTMDVPAGSHATPSQKNRLGKMERPRTRRQGPARGHNSNDNDDRLAHLNNTIMLLLFTNLLSIIYLCTVTIIATLSKCDIK